MNIADFSEIQKEALLDLIVLAMYADGHLAKAEDERIHALLTSLGFKTKFDRDKQYDASISRVSRHCQTAEAARGHAAKMAATFSTREQRQKVLELVEQIVITDAHIAAQENSLLSVVTEALRKQAG